MELIKNDMQKIVLLMLFFTSTNSSICTANYTVDGIGLDQYKKICEIHSHLEWNNGEVEPYYLMSLTVGNHSFENIHADTLKGELTLEIEAMSEVEKCKWGVFGASNLNKLFGKIIKNADDDIIGVDVTVETCYWNQKTYRCRL